MGKKSKATRKKAPEAIAAATVVDIVTTATALPFERLPGGEFPESTFFMKAKMFIKKGNHSKANKKFLQGIENGCLPCLNGYTMKILFDGVTIENRMIDEQFQGNIYLHLLLPLLLEAAIRGSTDTVESLCHVYSQVMHEERGVDYEDLHVPATPLVLYWGNQGSWKYDREHRAPMKQQTKEMKELTGTHCSVCKKEDSETVTLMKCDGCKFYYYCSKECQKKMWVEGQHAGVCRHLGLLNKYHKPFAKTIRKDLAVHGIAPRDIPELQELRQRLGLSRPQADYQELLEEAQAGRLDPTQLILPRKDGTVQIGSFPRPI